MTRFSALLGLSLLVGCGSSTAKESEFEDWEIEELGPSEGFTLRVPEFEVAPDRDSQNCYFVRVPDINSGGDIWIDRVLTAINPGSHHMNVFRMRTEVDLRPEDGEPVQLGQYEGTVIEGEDFYETSPCWDSGNWADWPLVANSQKADVEDPFTDWKLPENVAIRLKPGEMLMVQTHYVNSTDQPTLYGARVGINFYKHQGNDPIELGTLFATQQSIRICASLPEVTYSGTCSFPGPVTITAANGHFHSRGDRFLISQWDGTSTQRPDPSKLFYESDSWDEPPMAIGLNVESPAGGGIWWDCAYKWRSPEVYGCDDVNAKDPLGEGDCCYSFGGNTDVGEHCNVFLYYYPKVETDVYCN